MSQVCSVSMVVFPGDTRSLLTLADLSYTWATHNTLNVARHQAWRFLIPLRPMLAFQPLAMSRVSGVIGVAKNGVPIFAPPPTAGIMYVDVWFISIYI